MYVLKLPTFTKKQAIKAGVLKLGYTSCLFVHPGVKVMGPAKLPLAFVESEIQVINFRHIRGATLYDEFDKYRINSCVQNKMALKCAKNHGNCLRHFENVSDVSLQM